MSTFSLLSGARRGALSVRPRRRTRRFALACEPLETRQLLSISVFPAAIASGEAAQPATVQPNLSLTPLSSPGSPTGLSPSQVKTAYGVNQITFGNVVGNGAGQTIAIVDAYFDPNIRSDLAKFDAQFGLAAPPSFTQYVETGLRTEKRAGRSRPRSMWNRRTRSRPPRISCWSKRSPISPTSSARSVSPPSAGRLGGVAKLGSRRVLGRELVR